MLDSVGDRAAWRRPPPSAVPVVVLVMLVVTVAGGIAVAGWAHHRSAQRLEKPRGDPDPGGRVLADLLAVEGVVPAGSRVLHRSAGDGSWESCDGIPSSYGWDDIGVEVEFVPKVNPDQLIAAADAQMGAAGWRRLTPVGTPAPRRVRWQRTVAGGEAVTASLTQDTSVGTPGTTWEVSAFTPPAAHRVKGC